MSCIIVISKVLCARFGKAMHLYTGLCVSDLFELDALHGEYTIIVHESFVIAIMGNEAHMIGCLHAWY